MFANRFKPVACAGLGAAMLLLGVALPASAVAADLGGDTPPSKLEIARLAIQEGDYQAAVDELAALSEEQADNPDVLNLLGYSHRKLGRLEKAREYYLQALAIEPNHRGANEYLGELYLQVDDLTKAEERLAVLDDECFFPCEEYSELKAAVEKYKKEKGIE